MPEFPKGLPHELLKGQTPEELARIVEEFRTGPAGDQIAFRGKTVVAPSGEIANAVAELRNLTRRERIAIVRSVNRSLDKSWPRVLSGNANNEEFCAAAQDVVLWHANEIIEGRAPPEPSAPGKE